MKPAFTLAALASSCIVAFSTLLIARSEGGTKETPDPTPITAFALDLDLSSALYRSGLGPENLACAGLNADGAQTLIARAAAHMAEASPSLAEADAAFALHRPEVSQLTRTVRSGLATPEEIDRLATAKANLTKAEAQRQAAIEALFAAATLGLTAQQAGMLEASCHNQDWRLPSPYLCADRTELEWVQLRDALANERICNEDGTDPDGACQDLLAGVEAEAAIASALVGLETHGPSIQASWDAALKD